MASYKEAEMATTALIDKKVSTGSCFKKIEITTLLQLESILWFQKINKMILIRLSDIIATIKAIMQMLARIHQKQKTSIGLGDFYVGN